MTETGIEMKRVARAILAIAALGSPSAAAPSGAGDTGAPASGHVIETDAEVARRQTGPHDGGGVTTGHPFFDEAPGLELAFRKRALHPGSAIGYHPHDHDEIYYVVSGTGELNLNGETRLVGPGTAILTRAGDGHGLRQIGDEDLVVFIVYGKEPE